MCHNQPRRDAAILAHTVSTRFLRCLLIAIPGYAKKAMAGKSVEPGSSYIETMRSSQARPTPKCSKTLIIVDKQGNDALMVVGTFSNAATKKELATTPP